MSVSSVLVANQNNIDEWATRTAAILRLWSDNVVGYYEAAKAAAERFDSGTGILSGLGKTAKGAGEATGFIPTDDDVANEKLVQDAVKAISGLNAATRKALREGEITQQEAAEEIKANNAARIAYLRQGLTNEQQVYSDTIEQLKDALSKREITEELFVELAKRASEENIKIRKDSIAEMFAIQATESKYDSQRVQLKQQMWSEIGAVNLEGSKRQREFEELILKEETLTFERRKQLLLQFAEENNKVLDQAAQREFEQVKAHAERRKEQGYSIFAEDIKIAEAEIKLLEKKFENRKYVLLKSLQLELALLENDAEKRKAILAKPLDEIENLAKDSFSNLQSVFAKTPSDELHKFILKLSKLLNDLSLDTATSAEEIKKLLDLRTQLQIGLAPDTPMPKKDKPSPSAGTDELTDFEQTIRDRFTGLADVMTQMKFMALDAFQAMADGFGAMVEQWVLYGNAGEGGLRKMVASVLANVARIAATYAIMSLAAAALATTVWGAALLGGTPAQFLQAAALFGAVAVAAAVAGRFTAGNLFQQTSEQAATAGSGSSGNASSSPSTFTQNPSTEAGRESPIFAELLNSVRGLSNSVAGLEAKITSMSPNDIVSVAAESNDGTFTRAVHNEMGKHDGLRTDLGLRLGLT